MISLIILIVVSIFLAVAAALDGISTSKTQKEGAIEVGPAGFIMGVHPSDKRLIFAGGGVIAGEIAALFLIYHFIQPWYGQLIFSIWAIVQGVIHLRNSFTNKNWRNK